VGSAPSHQPEFRLAAREAARGASRALRATYQYPQIATDSTTGLVSVVNRASFDGNWVLPKGMNTTDINEFASQVANLIVSTLMKDCVKAGYSAS